MSIFSRLFSSPVPPSDIPRWQGTKLTGPHDPKAVYSRADAKAYYETDWAMLGAMFYGFRPETPSVGGEFNPTELAALARNRATGLPGNGGLIFRQPHPQRPRAAMWCRAHGDGNYQAIYTIPPSIEDYAHTLKMRRTR